MTLSRTWSTLGYEELKDFFEKTSIERIPQALCLVGPEGVGKATFWREVAQKYFKVPHPGHPDLITVNASDANIEQMRQLNNFSQQSPFVAERRVILIENIDFANRFIANSWLKVFEEPHARVQFLLTAQSTRILPTIRSRLVLYSAPLLSESALKTIAATSGWNYKPEVLAYAGGSAGLLLQLANLGEEFETMQLLLRRSTLQHDAPAALRYELYQMWLSLAPATRMQYLTAWIERLRIVCKTVSENEAVTYMKLITALGWLKQKLLLGRNPSLVLQRFFIT